MSGRLIDVGIEQLPFIDTHEVVVDADTERTWTALVEYLGAIARAGRGHTIARALGCDPAEASGTPGEIGSALPGFLITRAIRPGALALMGRHRFSRYALIFELEPAPGGGTRLVAETRARFPGRRGAVYRALVIGSRGHVLAVRRILRGIASRAER